MGNGKSHPRKDAAPTEGWIAAVADPEVTQWQGTVEPTTDGFFLWNVAPGFAGSSHAVTVCRTTHPEFCESMRLFGVPINHPSRLEEHGSILSDGYQGPGWRIVVTGRSHVGVIQYRILDATNTANALTLKGSGLVGLGSATEAGSLWYLVPRPDFGWDIANASNGHRLDVGANGSGLQLTPALAGWTHWDVLRPGRTKGFHRSHFWMPPFFGQAFCNQPRGYSMGGSMQPVVGNRTVKSANANSGATRNHNEADALRTAEANPACTLLALNNNGTATYYEGWTADPANPAFDPLNDPVSITGMCMSTGNQIDRERQLFGDTRARGSDGTGEYNDRWVAAGRPATGVVLYERRPPPADAAAAYRSCVLQLGMDATECEALLKHVAPTPAEKLEVQRRAFEQVTGQPPTGLYGPVPDNDKGNNVLTAARLWSKTGSEFCRTGQSRAEGYCQNGLLRYCENQNSSLALHDPMCACYLTKETYKAIRSEANQKLGATSPLAAKINEVIATNKIQDYCWYAPCQKQDNRPADSSCPGGDVYACIQVSSDNSYSSGGSQDHMQTCKMGTGETSKEEVKKTPPPSFSNATGAAGGRAKGQTAAAAAPAAASPAADAGLDAEQKKKIIVAIGATVVLILLLLVLLL